MSQKRRNSSSVEPDSPPPKRRFGPYDDVADHPADDQRPQVDSITGQTGAFPGLGDDDGVLFYGPAADGIDYLRMVRSERKGIPELLTSTLPNQDPLIEDGGYYHDGAFTAQKDGDADHGSRFQQAQEYYYESLLQQFRLIRATMRCIPPLEIVQSLGESKPISFPSQSKQAKEMWQSQIADRTPHPAQIACMDTDSILQLILFVTRRMTRFFKSNKVEDIERTGAWMWAILGKCPERGELGSDEISILRSFARRADEVSSWLAIKKDGDVIQGGHPEYAMSDNDSDMESFSSTDQDYASHTVTMHGDLDTKRRKDVILDAIITVVGEVYGQRDLLELRAIWPEESC